MFSQKFNTFKNTRWTLKTPCLIVFKTNVRQHFFTFWNLVSTAGEWRYFFFESSQIVLSRLAASKLCTLHSHSLNCIKENGWWTNTADGVIYDKGHLFGYPDFNWRPIRGFRDTGYCKVKNLFRTDIPQFWVGNLFVFEPLRDTGYWAKNYPFRPA